MYSGIKSPILWHQKMAIFALKRFISYTFSITSWDPKFWQKFAAHNFCCSKSTYLKRNIYRSVDLGAKTGYWWHGVDLGVTDPGKAPMHWVMAPPDMLPIEEYMEPGPGDIDPPIPWWGELRGCIDGLELRELVNQALFPLVVKLTWPPIWRSSSCCLLRRSCRSSWRSSTSGTSPTAWSSWKCQN